MSEYNDIDIREHLPYLTSIVKEMKAKTILELGVYQGHSTRAFLKAAEEIGAIVVSIDWNDSYPVSDSPNWIFFQGNSGLLKMRGKFDILFIDTSHNYIETLLELEKYSPMVKNPGVILLHDTMSSYNRPLNGVFGAIKEFLRRHPNKWAFDNLENCNGLGILKRTKEKDHVKI